MRFALGTAAALILSVPGSAFAADLPVKAPMMAPVAVYNWTGLYIGANVGWGWGHSTFDITTPFVTGTTADPSGVIGGGQIGYNWQISPNWVFGIEGDFQGSGQKGDFTLAPAGFLPITGTDKLSWFATLRGRVGYAVDRWLVYATGGAAWVKSELTNSTANSTNTSSAWTIGGGVEAALSGNWSAKLEYLYIDTGNMDSTTGVFTERDRVHDNIFRAGINYRFGGPVVAKY
jgi:outer membrane immunogenic protein